MGILPQAYTLNSLDAFQRYGAFNVQAGTKFVDFEFQREVSQGKLKSEVCFFCNSFIHQSFSLFSPSISPPRLLINLPALLWLELPQSIFVLGLQKEGLQISFRFSLFLYFIHFP